MAKRKKDLFAELAQEAAVEAAHVPTDNESKALRAQVEKLLELQKRAHDLEMELNEVNLQIRDMQHEQLPQLMKDIGQDSMGLPDANADLELKPYYNANIAASWDETRRKTAFDWLIKNKHGDLIKTEVKVSLPRGNLTVAKKLMAGLKKQGLPATLAQTVHPGTLTAFVREQVESGGTVPLDVLGATVGHVVKIVPRKAKKEGKQSHGKAAVAV